MVTDVDGAGAAVVARAIVDAGGEARSLALDVTQAADWDEAIAATTEAFGGLTTLINNAGIFHPGGIEHETIAGWNRVIAINQTSILRGMQAALPLLLASGKGSIVNLSSLYGLVGSPNAFSYHASKAATLEFARKGVRVNTILPGQIQTAMFASITPEQAAAIAEATPMGHVGEPDDIAFGALYLASDEAGFVTGIDLIIDGGWAAG